MPRRPGEKEFLGYFVRSSRKHSFLDEATGSCLSASVEEKTHGNEPEPRGEPLPNSTGPDCGPPRPQQKTLQPSFDRHEGRQALYPEGACRRVQYWLFTE